MFPFRLLLAPFYYTAFLWTSIVLLENKGFVWLIIFVTALMITLTPVHLLEPRYFSPAIVISILNVPVLKPSIHTLYQINKNEMKEGEIKLCDNRKNYSNNFLAPYSIVNNNNRNLIKINKILLIISIFLCIIINIVTIYVFFCKSFYWPDKSIARFMY